MPRVGLSPDRVVEAAGEMADQDGWSELTLAGLAGRLGVRQPSLYKHIDSLDGLHRSISVRAKQQLGQVIARAAVGRAGPDAVAAICHAYREWVHEHPGQYAATIRAPDPDDAEDQQASNDVLAVVVAAIAGFDLDEDHMVDAARTVRSGVHGFVSLESAGGFGLPRGIDASFAFLVDTLIEGLRSASRSATGAPPWSGTESRGRG